MVLLYALKLVMFAFVVVGLTATLTFNHTCFAVAVVLEALVAGAMAVRAFSRMQVPYVQP